MNLTYASREKKRENWIGINEVELMRVEKKEEKIGLISTAGRSVDFGVLLRLPSVLLIWHVCGFW